MNVVPVYHTLRLRVEPLTGLVVSVQVVVVEGINDIGISGNATGPFLETPLMEPQTLIDAYRQIIARAHGRGIKVFGGTILSFEGANYFARQAQSGIRQW